MKNSNFWLNFAAIAIFAMFAANEIYGQQQCKKRSECPKDNCCRKIVIPMMGSVNTCFQAGSAGDKCKPAVDGETDVCQCKSDLVCTDGKCKEAPKNSTTTTPKQDAGSSTTAKPKEAKSCNATVFCGDEECCLEGSDGNKTCQPFVSKINATCSRRYRDFFYDYENCPCASNLNCIYGKDKCQEPQKCKKQSDCEYNECCRMDKDKKSGVCKKLAFTKQWCSTKPKKSTDGPYELCPCYRGEDTCEKSPAAGNATVCVAPKKLCKTNADCGDSGCCRNDINAGSCIGARGASEASCSNATSAEGEGECPCQKGLTCLNNEYQSPVCMENK